eukprot:GHVQ01036148.1.p1 GENE.GHVQ01036148.1~~GHVQ01036148.1.p1  ORF type:complete len:1019 (-),score=239.95 GHVQ01036148.1:799-3450(-)
MLAASNSRGKGYIPPSSLYEAVLNNEAYPLQHDLTQQQQQQTQQNEQEHNQQETEEEAQQQQQQQQQRAHSKGSPQRLRSVADPLPPPQSSSSPSSSSVSASLVVGGSLDSAGVIRLALPLPKTVHLITPDTYTTDAGHGLKDNIPSFNAKENTASSSAAAAASSAAAVASSAAAAASSAAAAAVVGSGSRTIGDFEYSYPYPYSSSGIPIDCVSIVIVTHNEHLYIQRTLDSIVQASSPAVLSEIIIIDDASRPPIQTAYNTTQYHEPLVKLYTNPTREGLIRSKIFGAEKRKSKSNIIVFLDCHVKPDPGWLYPIIRNININYKRVVVPIIPVLDGDTWEINRHAVGIKMMFDWDFSFHWYEDKGDWVPVMSGGLLGISGTWWEESGKLDDGLMIWGGENIEQSIRVWLCGGEIVVARDSVVGHVFRTSFPYSVDGKKTLVNKVRTAVGWLDEYKEKFFQAYEPSRSQVRSIGDISKRMEIKKNLGCQNFQWFVNRFKNVFMDRGLIPRDSFLIRYVPSSDHLFDFVKTLKKKPNNNNPDNPGGHDEDEVKEPLSLCVTTAKASVEGARKESRPKKGKGLSKTVRNGGLSGRLSLTPCNPDDLQQRFALRRRNADYVSTEAADSTRRAAPQQPSPAVAAAATTAAVAATAAALKAGSAAALAAGGLNSVNSVMSKTSATATASIMTGSNNKTSITSVVPPVVPAYRVYEPPMQLFHIGSKQCLDAANPTSSTPATAAAYNNKKWQKTLAGSSQHPPARHEVLLYECEDTNGNQAWSYHKDSGRLSYGSFCLDVNDVDTKGYGETLKLSVCQQGKSVQGGDEPNTRGGGEGVGGRELGVMGAARLEGLERTEMLRMKSASDIREVVGHQSFVFDAYMQLATQ